MVSIYIYIRGMDCVVREREIEREQERVREAERARTSQRERWRGGGNERKIRG